MTHHLKSLVGGWFWRSDNGVGRLVGRLGLVTAFGGSKIPVFSRPFRPTQPGHPSVGRCSE